MRPSSSKATDGADGRSLSAILLLILWAGVFWSEYDCSRLWSNALNAWYILRFPGFLLAHGLPLVPAGRYAGPLAWLAFLLAAATLSGRIAFHRLGLREAAAPDELVFSLGLGLGFLALLGLGLGLSGLLYRGLIRALVVSLAAAGAFYAWRVPLWEGVAFRIQRPGWPAAAAACLLIPLALMNLVGALSPEVFYDALVYHLALPQLYLLHHRIIPTPHSVYSGIPFNAEMLYALGMAVAGDQTAKLIPWALAGVIALEIWLWHRRLGDTRWGPLAVVLFYSCPMVCSESWNALVELHWCFFSFLAVSATLFGLESDRESWFPVSGIMAGLALGVKYNAFPTLAILLVLIVAARRNALRRTMMVIVPAALLILPWLVKNLAFYGDPVFPFFSRSVDWRGLLSDAKSRDLAAAFSTAHGAKDLFLSLFGHEWVSLDSIGAALLISVPLLLRLKWPTAQHRRLLAALVMSGLAWSLSTRMPRFLIFALPLWAIVVSQSISQSGPLARGVMVPVLLAASLINCGETFNNWFGEGGWSVVFGATTKAEYLDHNRGMYPAPYYAGMGFINTLPPGSKVLAIGDFRGYYCERDFVAQSPFAAQPIVEAAERAKSGMDLRDMLLAQGITHLLINRVELSRVGYLRFPHPAAEARFEEFAKNTRLVFEKRRDDPRDPMWVQVFEIVDANGRVRPATATPRR